MHPFSHWTRSAPRIWTSFKRFLSIPSLRSCNFSKSWSNHHRGKEKDRLWLIGYSLIWLMCVLGLMGKQKKIWPGNWDLEYHSLFSEKKHTNKTEKLTAYDNVIMGRNLHQILFCRSLDEGRWARPKILEKASEGEEKLRQHVKSSGFGQVEREAVSGKWGERARERIRWVFMRKGERCYCCLWFVSVTGFHENQAKIVCNYSTCNKSGPFCQVMNT